MRVVGGGGHRSVLGGGGDEEKEGVVRCIEEDAGGRECGLKRIF